MAGQLRMLPFYYEILKRAWPAMVAATSQSTLGLCIWTIGLAATGWFVRRTHEFIKQRKNRLPAREAVTMALRGGISDAIIEAIAIFIIAVLAWAAFVPVIIYRDHRDTLQANTALSLENRRLQQTNDDLVRIHPKHGIESDGQFASISQVLGAFHFLQSGGSLGRGSDICRITITAPDDTLEVAKEIGHLAAWNGCIVEPPEVADPRADPDAAAKAARGAIPNTVIVHASRAYLKADGFMTDIGNVLDVRRSYEMPNGSHNDMIWLQFGPGNVWRKD